MINTITAGPDRSVLWRLRALSFLAVTSLLVVGASATASPAEARGGGAATQEDYSYQKDARQTAFNYVEQDHHNQFLDNEQRYYTRFLHNEQRHHDRFFNEMDQPPMVPGEEYFEQEERLSAEFEAQLESLNEARSKAERSEEFLNDPTSLELYLNDLDTKENGIFQWFFEQLDRLNEDFLTQPVDLEQMYSQEKAAREHTYSQEKAAREYTYSQEKAARQKAFDARESRYYKEFLKELSQSQNAVDPNVLGSAGDFKLLAGAAITAPGSTIYGNVGAGAAITVPGSAIHGDVGAGAAITMPGTSVAGSVTAGAALTTDALTAFNDYPGYQSSDVGTALNDLAAAYETLRAVPATIALAGDLSGQTLKPGVYHADAAFTISGNLTLDADHNDDAQFIFQGDGAMVTAAMSRIILINGASAENIFWVLDGAATFGANSVIRGNIVSNAAITFGANSELHGSALSVGAAITMPLSSAQ
jgi:hypothetical protein